MQFIVITHAVFEECEENPCQNGGTCTMFAGDIICQCPEGLNTVGSFCQTSTGLYQHKCVALITSFPWLHQTKTMKWKSGNGANWEFWFAWEFSVNVIIFCKFYKLKCIVSACFDFNCRNYRLQLFKEHRVQYCWTVLCPWHLPRAPQWWLCIVPKQWSWTCSWSVRSFKSVVHSFIEVHAYDT